MEVAVLDLDASTLAEKIARKEISSLEATEQYISHLQKINPVINCLVEDRFELARAEAKKADEELQNGAPAGRLFGVPISVKESYDVAGMKTTGGLLYRKNYVAEEDAEVVSRLKSEGAIVLGKTNTPTLCFCQETDNKIYGRTNNPWNPERTVGGSSGGEAALIAAGGAAVGVGSDIGGSIRFPSHFNGVIGFKSGNGQVSGKGHFPYIEIPLQERMVGLGALAKSVRDARMINEIIAEVKPDKRNLNSFSLVIPHRQLYYPADPSTREALAKAGTVLQEHFVVLDEQPPGYQEAVNLWQLAMSIDGAKGVTEAAFGGQSPHLFREYLKEKLWHSSDLHHFLTWAIIAAKITAPRQTQIPKIEKAIAEGDLRVAEFFEERLLILPVYHRAAPVHGKVIQELFSLRMTFRRYLPFVAYANTWGLPALIVPVAEDQEGLPIALQIISQVGNEDAIFQTGKILEKAMRGYKRCSG